MFYKEIEKREKYLHTVFSCMPMYSQWPSSSLWVWVSIWWHFLPFWWTSFSISCSERLLVMNSLSFCGSGNIFISPSFLKNTFIGYWQVFFPQHCHFTDFRLPLFLVNLRFTTALLFSVHGVAFLSLLSRCLFIFGF